MHIKFKFLNIFIFIRNTVVSFDLVILLKKSLIMKNNKESNNTQLNFYIVKIF
jgi:hypothetical protein